MNSKAAQEKLEKALQDLGIPPHLAGIKRVPSKIVMCVAVGGKQVEIEAPSGITESELQYRIGQPTGQWQLYKQGQKGIITEAQQAS